MVTTRKGLATVNHHDYEVNQMVKSVSNLNGHHFDAQNDAVDRVSIDLFVIVVGAVVVAVVTGFHFINELIYYLLLVLCSVKLY